MPTDFSGEQDAQFESDMQRARGYKPVTAKEMKQAYKQYDKEGLKFGQVKKNASDEQLYKRAEHIVLEWWKRSQKEKIQQKKARQRRLNDPLAGINSNWSGGNYSGGGTGGYGGGSGMLPDTAMRPGARGSNEPLPDIREHLNPRQVREHLRALGVPDTWNPPSHAERNAKTLEAWAKSEAERRDLIMRANGLRAYYADNVVHDIASRIGFPINPASVPLKYRQSHREIRNYILRLKKAWDQTTERRAQTNDTVNRTSAAYLAKMRDFNV